MNHGDVLRLWAGKDVPKQVSARAVRQLTDACGATERLVTRGGACASLLPRDPTFFGKCASAAYAAIPGWFSDDPPSEFQMSEFRVAVNALKTSRENHRECFDRVVLLLGQRFLP